MSFYFPGFAVQCCSYSQDTMRPSEKFKKKAGGMVEPRRTATKVGVGESFVLIALFPSFLLPSLSTLNKPPLAMPYKHTYQTDKNKLAILRATAWTLSKNTRKQYTVIENLSPKIDHLEQ